MKTGADSALIRTEKPLAVQRFYWPELDGLRFIAFMLVFLHHMPFTPGAPKILSEIHAFGWFGVDIFLVLSGYLLTSLAIAEKERVEVLR